MKLLSNLMTRRGARSQGGFTMVELAVVLVVAGLILVAVLKGTDTINKAKAERAVADLRGLQGMILEYQKRNNRLPGDCNNDGKIAYTFQKTPAIYNTDATNAKATKDTLDSDETHRNLPGTATGLTAAAASTTESCASGTANEDSINILWNDLRRNNIVDPQRLPVELAKNANGSYYAVGNMADKTVTSNNANVIVVYSIPVWMAEAIDVSIDGVTQYSAGTSAANTGRIRRWDTNGGQKYEDGTFANGFAKDGETRDTLIAISYQFDVNKLPN